MAAIAGLRLEHGIRRADQGATQEHEGHVIKQIHNDNNLVSTCHPETPEETGLPLDEIHATNTLAK